MNYFIMALIALGVGLFLKPGAKKEEAVAAASVTNSQAILNKTVTPPSGSVLTDSIITTAGITETVITPEVVTAEVVTPVEIVREKEAGFAGAHTERTAEGGLELGGVRAREV